MLTSDQIDESFEGSERDHPNVKSPYSQKCYGCGKGFSGPKFSVACFCCLKGKKAVDKEEVDL